VARPSSSQPEQGLDAAFAKLRRAAAGLPDIDESTSYGTPSLTVRRKFLCRVKDAETLVLACPLEEKDVLLESAPDVYFETAHYRGWPAILARIDAIDEDELRHRLRLAFLMQAPKTQVRKLLEQKG
jgi:hypothetical protein